MEMYSYIITRDFGFAPNPFGEFCTLATCKPSIRKIAKIGDWVIATGPKTFYNKQGYLFLAMKVEEKLTFNEYWKDERFQYKKPVFNGSLKQCFGDNIYVLGEENKVWHQQDSHHSLDGGEINKRNLKNDTKSPYVLISKQFYYFGKGNIEIPNSLKSELCNRWRFPLYKLIKKEIAQKCIQWLETSFEKGIQEEPMEFEKGFKRFDGKS